MQCAVNDTWPAWAGVFGAVRDGGRPVYLVVECARPRMARAPHLVEMELLRQLC
jgi:hypothetical protein